MSAVIGNTGRYMVIDILADGGMQAMHREDVLNIAKLGHATISRASDIVHNPDTQCFDIHLAQGSGFAPPLPEATGFGSYEDARQMEVLWLEMARLHDVLPESDEGRKMLHHLRAAHRAPTH